MQVAECSEPFCDGGSQEAGDFLDCVLHMTIGLGIITREEADENPQEVKEGGQDFRNKLWP